MKVFLDIEQGSPEWHAIRRGKATASNFNRILTATGKLSAQSDDYIIELIAECFVPEWETWSGNLMTDRGSAMESEAREAFLQHTGIVPQQVGFILSDDGVCGCSPDSMILGLEAGKWVSGIEIKCPSPQAHIGYVLGGELPAKYRQQVHGSMAVTGLDSWHFWSYFPGLAPLHVLVKRDEYTFFIERALADFVIKYREAYGRAVEKLSLSK